MGLGRKCPSSTPQGTCLLRAPLPCAPGRGELARLSSLFSPHCPLWKEVTGHSRPQSVGPEALAL